MRTKEATIPWKAGLHARPAAALVKLARSFRSAITLRADEREADARSIHSLLMLCASMGTTVVVEASGEDEQEAVVAVVKLLDEGELSPGED